MLFTTIEPAPGLSRSERRLVRRSGPSAVLVRTDYISLLRTAGFTAVEHRDITDDYATTQQDWIVAMRRRAAAMTGAMGEAAFEERLADRSRALAAIRDGLLRRSRYTAERPSTGHQPLVTRLVPAQDGTTHHSPARSHP